MSFRKKIASMGIALALIGGGSVVTAEAASALPTVPARGHQCADLHRDSFGTYFRIYNRISDNYKSCTYRVHDQLFTFGGTFRTLPNYTIYKRY